MSTSLTCPREEIIPGEHNLNISWDNTRDYSVCFVECSCGLCGPKFYNESAAIDDWKYWTKELLLKYKRNTWLKCPEEA